MRTRAAVAAVLLLPLLLAGSARAGDLSAEEQRWVKDLVAALAANSPRVRKGAEESLAKMGVDALPTIADALPNVKGEAALKGLRRALEGMGRAEVSAALTRLTQAASTRAAAKRFEDLAALLGGGPGSAADGVVPASIPLVPARLDDWTLAPLAVERRIEGRIPPELVPGVFIATPELAALRVDTDGDAKMDAVLVTGAARVIEVGPADRKVPLLVYWKGGAWWACPAGLLRGGSGSNVVEVLDADLDGRFDGPRDQLRLGDGAFGAAGEEPKVALEDRIVAWRVSKEGGAWRMALSPEPPVSGFDADAIAGLGAVNRLRRGLGLPPVRLNASRCDACRKHALYLQQNDGSPETAGIGAHREIEGKPGYTSEGAAAGVNSILSGATDAGSAVDGFAATMLHGKSLLGPGTVGFGVGVVGGRGGATVVWGADPGPTGTGTGAPLVVPAPGQRRISVRGRSEEPPPDRPANWYGAPRGFPISAFTAGLGLRQVQIRLYASDGRTPIPGQLWNDAAPIRRGFGGGGAFFMPAAPLEQRQAYVAVVSGKGESGDVSWTWSFRTD